MSVGEGYSSRDFCDGQALASRAEALPRVPLVEGDLESLHELRGSPWDTAAAQRTGTGQGQGVPSRKTRARHCSGGLTAAVIVGLDISEGLLPPAPLRHISADRTGW